MAPDIVTDALSHVDLGKMNLPERVFAQGLTVQGRRWIAQPCSFPLPDAPAGERSYRPDFWLPDERLLIEVIGSREQRARCRRRAERFRQRYPEYRLELHEVFDARSRLPGMNRQPTHPGKVFLDEFLTPRKIPQTRAAREMNINHVALNAVVRGRIGVSAAMAIRFADYTGTTPQFWMNLQNAVDLYRAQREMAAAK